MFILTDNSIGKLLTNTNCIVITYYNDKTDILDIFDNNFPIDENIIPIITSILERAPIIYNYKQYYCVDNNIIIKQKIHKAQKTTTYPSFYVDVDILENDKLDIARMKLINTLIDNDDKQLIRMYSRITETADIKSLRKKQAHTPEPENAPAVDFTQTILNETEFKIVSWEYEWGTVDILINITTKMCNYQITINIIEDNKLIESRLASINDTLYKFNKIINKIINKIKCDFIIN